MTEKLTFTDPIFKYPNYPFPDEIAKHPMVLYHGSSSCFEEKINKEGLKVNKVIFSLEELFSITSMFDRLAKWRGHPGSYTTLQPFSISHDNKRHKIKPTFLASSAFEAICYAGQEDAGGEIAKAVRYAFDDLYDYLNNSYTRQKHEKFIQTQIKNAQEEGCIYNPPEHEINLEELANELKEKDHLYFRAMDLKSKTEYGIVYAIKFEEEDLENFIFHNFMGIKYFSDIPPSKIVGKAIVPTVYKYKRFSSFSFEKTPSWAGIISKMIKE